MSIASFFLVFTFEEAWYSLQLGNVVWAVPTMPFQQAEGLKMFTAGMGDIQVPQSWIHFPPNKGQKCMIFMCLCLDNIEEHRQWRKIKFLKHMIGKVFCKYLFSTIFSQSILGQFICSLHCLALSVLFCHSEKYISLYVYIKSKWLCKCPVKQLVLLCC